MELSPRTNQMDRKRARIEFDGALSVPTAGPLNCSFWRLDRSDTKSAEMVGRNAYHIITGLEVVL